MPPPSSLGQVASAASDVFLLQGTLRAVLDARLLVDPATGSNHTPTVIRLALHVACAMQYLHKVWRA